MRTMHGRHPDGPRPSASGSGLGCLGVSAGESGDATRERKVSLGMGKKNSELWEGGEERGRAREERQGQWNGVGDGVWVCSAAPMEERV